MPQNFKKSLKRIPKYKVMKVWAKIGRKWSICLKSETLRSFHLCYFCLSISIPRDTKSKKKILRVDSEIQESDILGPFLTFLVL